MGGKRSDSAGGGMGGKLSPTAIIVIKDGISQIINVNEDKGSLAKVLDMIPGVTEKVKNIISKKTITDEEMEQINEFAENMEDQEF